MARKVDGPEGKVVEKPGFLKGVMASLCHHCPLCRYARRVPGSLVGRFLHHPLHSEHCPFWKAEREAYRQEPQSLP